jgi:dihydroxyacetone kinase
MHLRDFLLQNKFNELFFQMPGHFINEVSSCVDDSLVGYVRTYSHLELAGRSVISRAPITAVAVISGCGSGHEPAMVK